MLSLVALFLAFSPSLRAAPLTLIESDFGTAAQPVTNPGPAGVRDISGVVPEGWHDDSGWNDRVHVRYQTLTEGGGVFGASKMAQKDGRSLPTICRTSRSAVTTI